MPPICERRDVKPSVREAASADVVVAAETGLIWIDDHLVIAAGSTSECVPAAALWDGCHEVAVDSPGPPTKYTAWARFTEIPIPRSA